MKKSLMIIVLIVFVSTSHAWFRWTAEHMLKPSTVTPELLSDEVFTMRGVKLLNNSNSEAGTLRWTGTDFEGHDGSSWSALGGGGTTEVINIVDDNSGVTIVTERNPA